MMQLAVTRCDHGSEGTNVYLQGAPSVPWAPLDSPSPEPLEAFVQCNCCGSRDWRALFSENGFCLGQCPSCSLLYVDKMPSVEVRMTEMESGHFANNQVVVGAQHQLSNETARRDHLQRYVDVAAGLVVSGRWLDVGCGAGSLLLLAESAGYEVEGVELTADRREIARSAGLKVHDAPVEDLHFGDHTFQVISLINVFSHLTDPAATLRELRRILSPGGVLVLATGEVTGEVKKHHITRWNLGDHLYFLGDRTLETYADQIGFEVADHHRVWLPEERYSKEWLAAKGRSRLRNGMKWGVLNVPGAYRLVRSVMLRSSADNSIFSGTYALLKTG